MTLTECSADDLISVVQVRFFRRFCQFCFCHDRRELHVNKSELIAAVAETSGLSKNDAGRAIDGIFSTITSSLKKGDEVRLVGFGTFSISRRAATEGRNPRTGDVIKIPASKQPKFRAGKGLKEAVQ